MKPYRYVVKNVVGEDVGAAIDLSKVAIIERPRGSTFIVHITGRAAPVSLMFIQPEAYDALLAAWEAQADTGPAVVQI